jgi:hypothetical protein
MTVACVLGLIAAVVGVAFVWPFASRWVRALRPRLVFTDVRHNAPIRRRSFSKFKVIPLGESELFAIAIFPSPQTIRSLTVHFVEGRWRWWRRNAWDGQIRITDIKVPSWEAQAVREGDDCGPNEVIATSNSGGFVVCTRRPKSWKAGKGLFVEMTLQAEAPWVGYLSIELRGDEKNAYAQRRVFVGR